MTTRLTYAGDGYLTAFAVTFPYLSPSHVRVFVNDALQLSGMHYTLSGGSVVFNAPPGVDDVVVIQRVTSPLNALVDFTDGSTLKADELDTAYLHNFYLSQEYSDGFTKLIQDALIAIANGNQITVTDPDEVILQLVTEMLASSAAATLQQRITDIDLNAESIITLGEALQTQINTLAQGVAANVYIQPNEPIPGVAGVPNPILEGSRWYDSDDNNAPYIYQGGAWISIEDPRIGQAVFDISVLQTDVNDNQTAIVDEAFARSTADTAFATTLSLLGAQNGPLTAFILNTNTVKIDSDTGDSFATRFNTLATSDSNNAAAITSEQNARITADGVLAQDISLIGARNGTATAFILDTATVKLDTDAGVTVAQKFTTLEATDGALQGAIDAEQTARIAEDGILLSATQQLSASLDLKARTFAQTTAPTATATGDLWIRTTDNQLFRWNGTAWIPLQDAAIGANATAISGLTTTVGIHDGTLTTHAGQITDLGVEIATVDGRVDTANINIAANVTAISTAQGNINTLFAKYGVTLNVNGYITGFTQFNDGQSGSFVILADKFAVVDPNGGGGQTPKVPFEISGGKINLRGDVSISGSLILNGTVVGSALVAGTIGSTQIGANAITTTQLNANSVTADKIQALAVTAGKINVTDLSAINANLGTITAGTITLNSSGHIKSGQTAYATGTGFWLGLDGATPKFSIGNSTDFITWDGTQLIVRGNLSLGNYTESTNAADVILSAPTLRSSGPNEAQWFEVKKYAINKPGTLRHYFQAQIGSTTGGLINSGQVRTKLDGVVVQTTFVSGTTMQQYNHLVTTTETSQYITVEIMAGLRNPVEPVPTSTSIQNSELRGVIGLGEGVITD